MEADTSSEQSLFFLLRRMHLCGWFAGTSKTWLYEHVKLPIGYRPDSQSYPKTFNQLTDVVVVGDADQHT